MSKHEEYVTKIPLPLQTFFWRQASPYMNPRLGKQCEASCVTLERLLVQNIQHGLSPSISAAMDNMPRWIYLKASLPYVMHCCSTIIKNVDEAFTNYESKLLYTMHWLLLDAASECNVVVKESMFPLSSIRLFVYLFAPLLHKIEKKHFESLKLRHGLRIWESLWEFSQPQVIGMSSPVKQRVDCIQKEEEVCQSSQTSVYYGDDHEHLDSSKEDSAAILQATYFDVAVLQCLSNSRWPTSGVIWALNYIQRRLDQILEHFYESRRTDKGRSLSLSLPTIEINLEESMNKSGGEAQDDEEYFRPKSRITEETLLKNRRPKTESHIKKSKKKSASDSASSSSSVSSSIPHDLIKVSQDILADIEEEETVRFPLTTPTHSEGKDRRISSNSVFASVNVGPVKKSNSAAPVLKVTPPNVDTEVGKPSLGTIPKWKSEPAELFNSPVHHQPTSFEFEDEVPGSTHYITEDGCMDYNVILRAIHLVMVNTKEQDVGIEVLKIVDELLQLFTLLTQDGSSSPNSNKHDFDDSTYSLFMQVAVNCVIALGCPTCTHLSTPSTSSSRNQTGMVLHNLHRVCNQKFCKFFENFAEASSLMEIFDFFHSYMGFCTHGNTQNMSDRLVFTTDQSGYATNFGHSITGEGHRGVEGIIVVHTLKSVVTRLSTTLADPTKSDNVLYPSNERLELHARKFLNYTQDVHGGTFRCVAFSGLLDSSKKLKEDDAKRAAAKLSNTSPSRTRKVSRRSSHQLRRKEQSSKRNALSDTEVTDDHENNRKNLLDPSANTRAATSDVEDVYTDEDDFKQPKLSFHALSQATVAMIRARQKVKQHIRMMSSRPVNKEPSGVIERVGELYTGSSTSIEARERRLVDTYLIRSGMLRFNLMINVSYPGSLPEPEFLAALLQLDAPVAARASLFLECAYFVNQCTQGNWPSWIQFDSSTSTKGAGHKRTVIRQRTAAGLFYRWAEAIGLKLKSILSTEEKNTFVVINETNSEVLNQSVEEDFLDEATFTTGNNSKVCPHALKMVASLLVYEVTTFLREVYQHLPVVHSQHLKTWQAFRCGRRTSYAANTSMKPSSPTPEFSGYPHHLCFRRSLDLRRSHIRESVVSARQQRISVMGGLESTSGAFGSNTSINSAVLDTGNRKGSGALGRSKKTSASPNAASTTGVLMRNPRSIKAKSTGTRSAKSSASSVPPCGDADDSSVFYNTADSAAVDDQRLYAELYDELHNKLNWLTSIIQLASVSNFICEHIGPCHHYCFSRQNRSCRLLTKALEKIYEVDVVRTEEEPNTAPVQPVVHNGSKRPSVTRSSTHESMLIGSVLDATMGKRRSMDKSVPINTKDVKKRPDPPPIIAYLKKHSSNLMSIPLSTIMKSAAVLKEDEMENSAAVAWEFLLESDKELVATAASVLLMVAGQVTSAIHKLMLTELSHSLVENRISAIRKFYVLWTYRYQIWSRLEPGAQMWFKVMPPSIDYTLPSPPVGLPGQIVPDPPWMPLYKLKLEELAANQEGSKSLVTATNTRRKQQQEMVAKALVAEECRKREAREAFPLSSVAVSIQASQEFTKSSQLDSDETSDDTQEQVPVKEIVTAHSVFPTCICQVGLKLLDKLDDAESHSGTTVGAMAESVIKRCIIEDASLFFRYLFEKLTCPIEQEEMFVKLRKLLAWMPNLPSNAAYTLFNNLVGYILYYNRSANVKAQVCMNQAMTILSQLVPSVQGLSFKDLKTMLKKQQSEQTLMVTAHLPSAKKVLIHGIDSERGSPTFMIHEDTQFKHLLQESLDYFRISENLADHQIADAKTNRLYSRHDYVRDYYVFRRDTTPQLKLIKMPYSQSFNMLQQQAMNVKFIEMCKVELAKNILKFSSKSHVENQVLFLHEEFSKQVAFPRKALETEFSYFVSTLGSEMHGTDVTHKLSWIQFLETLFMSMPGTFGWTNELKLFLNVINGCIILNCADHGMLRACIAIYLNLANHFKQVFATDGFMLIMPTIIKVFNTHSNYPTLRAALLFLHQNFYKLHRRAYLLQFLGSYEPSLSACETKEEKLVLAEQLFALLHSLENELDDVLGVLHMLWNNETVKTLDFCYDDNEEYTVLDAINTMITVVAYQAECHRSTQMLVILEAIVPWYMKLIIKQAQRGRGPDVLAASEEIGMYGRLSQSIRALIAGAEPLMKPLTAQHRLLEGVTSLSGHKKDLEESVASTRNIEEGRFGQEHDLELRTLKNDFRKPRDALLSIVSEFFTTCLSRLELLKPQIERLKITSAYFLDTKSHERLGEVAHSLLKVGTYDPETISCRGLQRYVQEILPEGDWSQESVKNAINIITKRLERIFVKVHKRSNVRVHADWDALATLLRGICLTLESQPTLHHLAHVKSLVNSCILIVLEYGPGMESALSERWTILPNHIFCTMVAKLAAQHAAILGISHFRFEMETGGIEQMCGGAVPTSEKVEMMLANFVIPLCLRIGGNDREKHIIPQADIRFILCLILSSLIPNSTYVEMLKPKHPEQFSIHVHHGLGHSTPHLPLPTSVLLHQLALLGLKTLLVCCDDQLYNLLPILSKSVMEIGEQLTGVETLKFFNFLVTVRTVLYPLIKPYIHSKLLHKVMTTEDEDIALHNISCSIKALPSYIHKTQLLAEFAKELDMHRKTHISSLGELLRSASVSAGPVKKRRFSTWRKSSLISKIHQNDHSIHTSVATDHPPTIINASSIRAAPHCYTTDETDSGLPEPKLSRNKTTKGSRYGSKNPLKRISAPEGAKIILDKFKTSTLGMRDASSSKQYYVGATADSPPAEYDTEEEQLAHAGRRLRPSLQLIRQPHVIIEEESVSPPVSVPATALSQPPSLVTSSASTTSSDVGMMTGEIKGGMSGESSGPAPPVVLNDYTDEKMAASKPPVPVTSAKTGLDPALSTAELQPTHVVTLESDRPSKDISHAHGLHRQGALYQHEHHDSDTDGETVPLLQVVGKEPRGSCARRLSNEPKLQKSKTLKQNIAASPLQASTPIGNIAAGITTTQSRKNQIKVETVKPEQVVIEMPPVPAKLRPRESLSKLSAGSSIPMPSLKRKGSDTEALVSNEETLAKSESCHKIMADVPAMCSASTTFTSAGSSLSTDSIPFMDNSSCSDVEL